MSKKRNKTLTLNYRLFALVSIISKVMENKFITEHFLPWDVNYSTVCIKMYDTFRPSFSSKKVISFCFSVLPIFETIYCALFVIAFFSFKPNIFSSQQVYTHLAHIYLYMGVVPHKTFLVVAERYIFSKGFNSN